MQITIGRKPTEGMIEVAIEYREVVGGLANCARLTLWVPYTGSMAEMQESTNQAAKDFLSRALSAHSSVGQKE